MKFTYFWLLAISGANLFVDAMHGGDYFPIKDVPYMAQLYFEAENGMISYCGATILSEYWLVSAAHCVGLKGMVINQVRVGSTFTAEAGNVINITRIIVNGNYETNNIWDSDISLIKLQSPIEFDEKQQPIHVAREPPKVGDSITISGFGYSYRGLMGESLQVGHVPVIDDETCRVNYTITKNMFCTSTSKIDLCYGDSGGPAVLDGKLVGIVSQGCEITAPNVFTKVANFYNWIIKHTGIKYDD
ncbi:hypothetical protein TSAR_001426 [Trichomalopsis sarcophagae]|uniref:trypsin n=1 Tax=Trichomalopsis sarcophagae TaxID=543379 RepID=A0A232EUL6_9HYME|nr:hypothetical protein TSAR_001426 [Trichomalopsis sarcophagae]